MPGKIHLTVAAVIKHNNQYLLVKETDCGKSVINQPAGHVEPGEDIVKAAIRETYEETGWHIAIENLVGIYSSKSEVTGITYYRIAFSAKPISLDSNAQIDADIDEVVWLSLDEIYHNTENLRSEVVLTCILDFEQGQLFPLEIFRNHL